MARFIDPLYVNNLIDANILDDVADGQDEAVNEIVHLAGQGKITVLLPFSVRNEAKRKKTPEHVRRAADLFSYSKKVCLTEGEQEQYRNLLAAAKGDAEEKNIAADLAHVCEAAKYGGYFITRDKRLLARAAIIATMLQIDLVTPTEFLARIKQAKERALAHFPQRIAIVGIAMKRRAHERDILGCAEI